MTYRDFREEPVPRDEVPSIAIVDSSSGAIPIETTGEPER